MIVSIKALIYAFQEWSHLLVLSVYIYYVQWQMPITPLLGTNISNNNFDGSWGFKVYMGDTSTKGLGLAVYGFHINVCTKTVKLIYANDEMVFSGLILADICLRITDNKHRQDTRDPFYPHGVTLIPAWPTNRIHYKLWDEITYLILNFSDYTIDV